MQVILKNSPTLDTYHVQQDVGRLLIAAGLATEVQNGMTTPKPGGKVEAGTIRFWVGRDGLGEDGMPVINYDCDGPCTAKRGRITSTKGTAHLTVVSHCGDGRVPKDVADKYQTMWDGWSKRNPQAKQKKKFYSNTF